VSYQQGPFSGGGGSTAESPGKGRGGARRGRRSLLRDFEELLEHFPKQLVVAAKSKTAEPRHDMTTRIAIRGFSVHSRIYKWAAPQFMYLHRNATQRFEAFGPEAVSFAAFAFGYMLGLALENKIDTAEFKAGEIHLEQFVMLHLVGIRQGWREGWG
jgi:hypothetical protein